MNERTKEQTDWVTMSLLELFIAAKNVQMRCNYSIVWRVRFGGLFEDNHKKNNNCSLEVWSNWCQLFYYLNHVTQVQFKTRKTSWGWTGPSSAPAGTGLYFNQDLLKLGWAPANYLTLPYQRCILTEYRQLSQNTLQTPTNLVPGMGSPQIKQNCI